MRLFFFWACTAALILYAMRRGGRPEKAGALLTLAAAASTWVFAMPLARRFTSVEAGVLIVDLCLLAGFVVIALRSDRYWPLWASALQLIGVAAHLARLADVGMPRVAYGIVMAMWSYPIMLTIALGVHGYRKALRTPPPDRSAGGS